MKNFIKILTTLGLITMISLSASKKTTITTKPFVHTIYESVLEQGGVK